MTVVADDSPQRLGPAVVGVCRRHELTLYDALYLDLALREEADLGVHEWIEASFRHVLSSGL